MNMNITFWKIFLAISSLSIIMLIWYAQKTRKHAKAIKIALFTLLIFILFLGYQSYIWYNKKYNRPISTKKYKLSVPFEAEPKIKEYLGNISKERPVVVAIPLVVQIRFTDPMSPDSPHALSYILLKNEGNLRAVDVDVKWEITDNERRITPPDEWNKIIGRKDELFVLNPNQYITYLYGPEIGAYARTLPPNIELILRINYRSEDGKEYSYYCKGVSNPNPQPKDTYLFDVIEVK